MRIKLLKPYGREFGWGKFNSFFGIHYFEYGGIGSQSIHLWPFMIDLYKNPRVVKSKVLFISKDLSNQVDGTTYVTRFGFFTPEDIQQAKDGDHCGCSHDCCGCHQMDAYYVPLAFGFGYIKEHRYINV